MKPLLTLGPLNVTPYSLMILLGALAGVALAWRKKQVRPLLPAAIMGVVVYGLQKGLVYLLGATISSAVLCGACIIAGGLVYLVFVVVCKVITYEDCLLLPKGEKLAKVLKL